MTSDLCFICGAYWDCGCTARFWNDPVFHEEIMRTRAEFQFKGLSPTEQARERRAALVRQRLHGSNLALSGNSFPEPDDPYDADGDLTPEHMQALRSRYVEK